MKSIKIVTLTFANLINKKWAICKKMKIPISREYVFLFMIKICSKKRKII
jgi:hypothetical protein